VFERYVMILTRTDFLSPWKGCGFGMFASVDGLVPVGSPVCIST
jgi:hypothetical protein